MRIALDTNVLVYAEGFDDARKRDVAIHLLSEIRQHQPFVAIQVIGEVFNVLTNKGYPREDARTAALRWRDLFSTIDTSSSLMLGALALAAGHRLEIWDALVLEAAVAAECSILLSDDFQEGFTWQGVTVCNPFLTKPHRLIADLVRE